MKIAIIGLGGVALADALALARTHEVVMTGPVPDRVEAINTGAFDLCDPALAPYLARYPLRLSASLHTDAALDGADAVIVAPPLSFDPETGAAQLAELDSRIEMAARRRPGALIVVRSAVPVGYCAARRAETGSPRIVYAPEFAREGHRLSAVLHPQFLIVGDRGAAGKKALALLAEAALSDAIPTRAIGPAEAELTRHLSTLFQAARLAYFNELDSYALHHGLDARQIIDGVSLDPRIGPHANNPCFGYSSRSLPLSVNMLAPHLDPARTPLLASLETAHSARAQALTHQIVQRAPGVVAFYAPADATALPSGLAQIRARLEASGIATYVQRTLPQAGDDMVIAQRMTAELADIPANVFTRDHFMRR